MHTKKYSQNIEFHKKSIFLCHLWHNNLKGYLMTHFELVKRIEARRKELNITIVNLSKLSGLGVRTVNRFLAGEDVKLSTVERLTNLLGLDFAGNEVVSVAQLQRRQAKEKALLMVALVQGTSSLEMQGLEKSTVSTMLKKMEQAFLTGDYKKRLWVAE